MSARATAPRRLMVGESIPAVLRPSELRDLLGIDRTTFWEMEKAHALDGLRTGLPGSRTYSGVKLQRLIEGEALTPAEEQQTRQKLARHFLSLARRRVAG